MQMRGIMLALGLAMGCVSDKSSTTTESETKTSGGGKTTEIKTKTETKAGGGKTTETTTIETKTTETKTSDTKTDVGIAECDDYLVKMTECMRKMPAAAAASTTASLGTQKKGWKDAASTPEGKVAVATACKNALAAARSQFGSLGCTF